MDPRPHFLLKEPGHVGTAHVQFFSQFFYLHIFSEMLLQVLHNPPGYAGEHKIGCSPAVLIDGINKGQKLDGVRIGQRAVTLPNRVLQLPAQPDSAVNLVPLRPQKGSASRAVYPDYAALRRYEFYQCCLIELDAVLDLAKRYAEKAKEMAEQAAEPRKSELLRIAGIMASVPQNPAQSFYEALQSVQFFLSGLFGLYPLNRPDRYLYEYYKKDTEAGILTREDAQELIDNFCLHVSTRVFSRAACGFSGGQNPGHL